MNWVLNLSQLGKVQAMEIKKQNKEIDIELTEEEKASITDDEIKEIAYEEAHINRKRLVWSGNQERIRDIDLEIKQAKMEWKSGDQFHDSEDHYNEWRKR